MKHVISLVLAIFFSTGVYSTELIGIQSVKCGGKTYVIKSINAYDAMEILDEKNSIHEVKSYGLGEGGSSEWACIRLNKYYLVFRGSVSIHLSDSESKEVNVHDIFDTNKQIFVETGNLDKYLELLESNKVKVAKKSYPKLDVIYRRTHFKNFKFELIDYQ